MVQSKTTSFGVRLRQPRSVRGGPKLRIRAHRFWGISNAKCGRYFTPEIDGLTQAWKGVYWMNPPHGKSIGRWVRKVYESALDGTTVVCLIPSRRDTIWWHEYVTKANEVSFVRGRIRFGDAASYAPFPSTIVIFRGKVPSQTRWTRGVFYRRRLRQVTSH